MKAVNTSYQLNNKAPKFKIVNHSWFISLSIQGKESIFPEVSFYLDNLSTLIEFKNQFLSDFNRFMEELGYDK